MTRTVWSERAGTVARDRDAGASEILARLIPVVEQARVEAPEALPGMASIVAAAQPAMAGLHFLMRAAMADCAHPGRLAAAVAQVTRAPRALTRVALAHWDDVAGPSPWRVVTWSYSSAVAALVEALSARGVVDVTCAEGRPRFEGRRLAERLAPVASSVTVVTDGAAPGAASVASVLLVGADAVTPEGWINKVGTAGVAAVARRARVPVVVLASREKIVTDAAFVPRAIGVAGDPDDVWAPVPAGVKVANPTFELVRWDLADLLATDRDALPAESISPNSFI